MKINHTALGECDTYEDETEPPLGYIFWNIGVNAPEGDFPFCRLNSMQRFKGGREIESDTLIAMMCDGAREILAAIGLGAETSTEMKKFIKKITHTAKSAVTCVKTAAVNSMSAVLAFNRRAVCSNAGEGYIDTAVKVLIAVVLGALVLAGLYAILNDTVMPTVTQKITEMFSYNG